MKLFIRALSETIVATSLLILFLYGFLSFMDWLERRYSLGTAVGFVFAVMLFIGFVMAVGFRFAMLRSRIQGDRAAGE
jgi:hypothetical protein